MPGAGWAQIVAFAGYYELFVYKYSGTPGDYGWKVLTSSDPEGLKKKLLGCSREADRNAEPSLSPKSSQPQKRCLHLMLSIKGACTCDSHSEAPRAAFSVFDVSTTFQG